MASQSASEIPMATPIVEAAVVLTNQPTTPVAAEPIPPSPPSTAGAASPVAVAADADAMTETFVPCEPSLRLLQGRANDDGTSDVLIRVMTPENTRCPTDVVAVVDVSGSMGTSATVQTAAGVVAEDQGLTVLDITKHAVRTIIESLTPQDNFSLVSYSNNAKVCLVLTKMDKSGKEAANRELNQLQASGGTNLWDGLFQGLEQIRTNSIPSRNSTVLLLTDGQPNVVPPRGHLPMMNRYKDSNPDMNCSISTFGFGYNLDSQLLKDLALAGHGQYAFIPDAGFVGTTFVHSASNFLSTMARRVVLKVSNDDNPSYGETAKQETMHATLGGLGPAVTYPSWGIQIECANLTAGQTKDVVIRTSTPQALVVTLELVSCGLVEPIQITADLCAQAEQEAADVGAADGPVATAHSSLHAAVVQCQLNRLEFVDMLDTVLNLMAIQKDAEAQARVAAFGAKLQEQIQAFAGGDAMDPKIEGLYKDTTDQVAKAVSRRDWYNKWGTHYLPSLAQAHRLQQCNNFKDPGIQFYGGQLFNKIRDQCDALFMKLPPPTPSGGGGYGGVRGRGGGGGYGGVRGRGGGGGRGGAKTKSARGVTPSMVSHVPDMSTYNNRNCGCFHGESKVTLSDGSSVKVQDVRRGMRVRADKNSPKTTAVVLCVVETTMAGGSAPLTTLPGGCVLTPWHPVRVNGVWAFPIDIAGAVTKTLPCRSVFSFVLEDRISQLIVNGEDCIALGHNLTGPVAGHPYFGSVRVVEDLKKCHGWAVGHVQFKPNPLARDSKTDLLTHYRTDHEVVNM